MRLQSRAPTRPAGNSKAPAAFRGFVVRAQFGFEQLDSSEWKTEHVGCALGLGECRPQSILPPSSRTQGVLPLPPLPPPKEEKAFVLWEDALERM